MTIVPLLDQSAFEPEVIEILAAAFEDAWATIEKSGSSLASPRYKRVAQEIWPSASSRRHNVANATGSGCPKMP